VNDEGTPGWAALDRVAGDLYHRASPLAALSDEQLMRWEDASRRGEEGPPADVRDTLRAAMRRTRPPGWMAAMTDGELLAYLDREAELVRAENEGRGPRRQPDPQEDYEEDEDYGTHED